MSNRVNFSSNSSQIYSAHEKILQGDPNVSWAVFGFDKGTNDLNVEATGSGGIDELVEEFDSGKVQYAFARILDPKTKLNKFVFFSWCGSGVPVFKKGLLGSQIGDVQNVLKGYHVTINARSDDDILPESIMEKIEESTGSRYDAHSTKTTEIKRANPVLANSANSFSPSPASGYSSRYSAPKPAPPKNEVNPTPVKDVTSPKSHFNQSPPQKTKPISSFNSYTQPKPIQQVQIPINTKPTVQNQKSFGTKPLFTDAKPLSSIFGPKKFSVQNNSSENQSYMSKFEADKKQSANSFSNTKGTSSYSPANTFVSNEVKPVQGSSANSEINDSNNEASASFSQADQTKNELEMLRNKGLSNRVSKNSFSEANNNDYKDIKPSAGHVSKLSNSFSSPKNYTPQNTFSSSSNSFKSNQSVKRLDTATVAPQSSFSNNNISKNEPENEPGHHKEAIVLYSYQAEESNEMDLHEGEIITDVKEIDDGWWTGSSKNGDRSGMFPANFVEFIEEKSQKSAPGVSVPNPENDSHFQPPSLPPQSNFGKTGTSSFNQPPSGNGRSSFENSYQQPPPLPPHSDSFDSAPPPPLPPHTNSFVPPPPPQ
ncbi:Drebrin-like protein, partial [Smittium mucronatum]